MKQIQVAMRSESAVKYEMVPYTGTRGLYASVTPQFPEQAVTLARRLGIELDSNKVHITVCYSKKAAIPIDKLPVTSTSQEFSALCNEIGHWIGHKGQTCIVLKLVSPDIIHLNASLQSLGAEHTFTPYAPRISLSDDVPMTDAIQETINILNKELALNPITFICDHYAIGDQDN